MIDQLVELVWENAFEVLIILLFGIVTGVLFTGTSWKGQVRIKDDKVKDLEDIIEDKNVDIKKLRLAQIILKDQFTEIRDLNHQIEENKSSRIRLSKEINKKVADLEGDFKKKLEEREQNSQELNNQINEKNEFIELLKNEVANLEEINQEFVNRSEELKTNLGEVKTQLQEREQSIQELNTQVNEKNESIDMLKTEVANLEENNEESVNRSEQLKNNLMEVKTQLQEREQNTRDLNNLVNQTNESLDLLKYKVGNMEELNQESVKLTEQLRKTLAEAEHSVEEKTNEISSMTDRMNRMQDDLTIITGIGPKVASVLRAARINSFKKLGSTNVEKITEILDAKNPRLIRMTDPMNWPEQAKLAAEEEWEALSELQESQKGRRRAAPQSTPEILHIS